MYEEAMAWDFKDYLRQPRSLPHHLLQASSRHVLLTSYPSLIPRGNANVSRSLPPFHPPSLSLSLPGYYFSGDGALRDEENDYRITGRVDDMINSKGHIIGTAELECAMVRVYCGPEPSILP